MGIIFCIANIYVYVKKAGVVKFTKKNKYSFYDATFLYTTKEVLKVVNLINLAPAQISFWIGEIKWDGMHKIFAIENNE